MTKNASFNGECAEETFVRLPVVPDQILPLPIYLPVYGGWCGFIAMSICQIVNHVGFIHNIFIYIMFSESRSRYLYKAKTLLEQ
jgi:hypothetical protein